MITFTYIMAVIFLLVIAWDKLGLAVISSLIMYANSAMMLSGLGEPMLRVIVAIGGKTGGYYVGFHDGKRALATRQEENIDVISITLSAYFLAVLIFWIRRLVTRTGPRTREKGQTSGNH